MPLGTEAGLGRDHMVLDGNRAPPKRTQPHATTYFAPLKLCNILKGFFPVNFVITTLCWDGVRKHVTSFRKGSSEICDEI